MKAKTFQLLSFSVVSFFLLTGCASYVQWWAGERGQKNVRKYEAAPLNADHRPPER